jgi:hydroxylamine reductase
MGMFCYQCQETARGQGCTVRGVCGKTADVAQMQDLLLYVIKGISYYTTRGRELGLENEGPTGLLSTVSFLLLPT